MEYVEGETLQQTLDRDHRVPFEMAAEYVARRAATGLQHAHEKGFVHRDIKPGNLIRDRFGAIKILDMGLALRSASDRDKLTEKLDDAAVVGTADFIALEQAINCPKVDTRADIYALGATLYTLIVGATPFDGNTTQKLMQHQMKSAPKLIEADPTVPAELSDAVTKMLAKKPEDRFQTPAEVIAALAPWTGSSARVLAGLSRTNLGMGTDVRATMAAWSQPGSSLRLRHTAPQNDSSTFDLAEAAKATLALTAAETTSSRTPVPAPPPLPQPKPAEEEPAPALPAPRIGRAEESAFRRGRPRGRGADPPAS